MYDLPEGISVKVFNEDGKQIPIAPDGFLGHATRAQKLTLEVRIENPWITAVHVDNSNNVVPAALKTEDDVAVSSSTIPLKRTHTPPYVYHTEYSSNAKRLLGRVDNEAHAWQIAIVSQLGDLSVTCHITHQGPAYRLDDMTVVVPVLKKWRGHEELINGIFAGAELPSYDDYDESVDELSDLELPEEHRKENRGVVLFFNPARGFGALKTAYGSIVRFHWTAIDRTDSRLKYVDRGDIVHYSEIAEPVQTTQRSTKFSGEANRVLPIAA